MVMARTPMEFLVEAIRSRFMDILRPLRFRTHLLPALFHPRRRRWPSVETRLSIGAAVYRISNFKLQHRQERHMRWACQRRFPMVIPSFIKCSTRLETRLPVEFWVVA